MSVAAVLFAVFFKISFLSLGGGYNMIPLMQQEMERRGWLDADGFVQMLALSEVTPGPVAINLATFAGYRTAGLAGAAAATAGTALPGMLVLLLVGGAVARWRNRPAVRAAVKGMMLVLAAMLAATAVRMALALPPLGAAATVLRWGVVGVWTVLFAQKVFSPVWGLAAAVPAGLLLAAMG